jgi:hypothetical protein
MHRGAIVSRGNDFILISNDASDLMIYIAFGGFMQEDIVNRGHGFIIIFSILFKYCTSKAINRYLSKC